MTTPVPYIIQGNNIVIVLNNESHTISKDTHLNYNKIVDALKTQKWDALVDLMSPKQAIMDFSEGYVSIGNDGVVYWKDEPFNNALSRRMFEMYSQGFPITPMVNFMENLMQNPSANSISELYEFLERNSLPLTHDGHFLAYKKVRGTYNDIHSDSIYNGVGAVVQMERNKVDDNTNSHCSTGLHFCSVDYLDCFRSSSPDTDRVMILKINPKDVVSVPNDYNFAKGRCCKYEVVGEYSGDTYSNAFKSAVDTSYSSQTDKWNDSGSNWSKEDGNEGYDYSNVDALLSALYTVERKYGGHVVADNQTLQQARDLCQKAVNQKKAVLVIKDCNGDLVV